MSNAELDAMQRRMREQRQMIDDLLDANQSLIKTAESLSARVSELERWRESERKK